MKLPAIALTCLFSASFSQAASIHNYVELGLGANKLFSFNKNTNDNLSEFSVAPSLKVLTGSRLNQSRTLWFELGYSYLLKKSTLKYLVSLKLKPLKEIFKK